ncbi:MAG TPA: hypothetical protein PLL35_01585 [Candidatus Cloacimonas sp.]|nr:hypothetical protein [Candidatus Cloacimonas sp.]
MIPTFSGMTSIGIPSFVGMTSIGISAFVGMTIEYFYQKIGEIP